MTVDPAILPALLACALLVVAGAAVQVAVGAGLSVVCGPFLLLWLGANAGVPVLLCLNLVLSVAATAFGGTSLRWKDALLVSGAIGAGCAVATLLPPLPDPVLRGLTALVLAVVALPRPAPPGRRPPEASVLAGLALAGMVTGALTVWTATPGPVVPAAMARAGRHGADIRRTMQPVSVVGYGAALALCGASRAAAPGAGILLGLVAAVLAGTAAGFVLRRRIDPGRVVLLTRVIAGVSAVLLLLSLFR